ncbi:MAG: hypothetical protein ISS80_03470 [Candidatus Cloacimonetes bacterium]|nr:hypothetical protein [Candidatus Cloacimonadota bacterium]
MISMEREVLDVLSRNDGKIHYYYIANQLRIGEHYAYLICKGLERKGYVNFDTLEGICSLTDIGKKEVDEIRRIRQKQEKENIQKRAKENMNKILNNKKIISY